MEQEENLQEEQSSEDNEDPEDIVFTILVAAKREHLTFEELNMFRLKDFFKFSKSYGNTFDTNKNKKKCKKATQADIDRFYG